jgi:hypothetical protein
MTTGAVRSTHPFIRLSLLAAFAAGCQSWQTVGPSPAEYLQTHRAETVRITRPNGYVLELRDPLVVHDSLTGLPPEGPPVSIPLSEIDSMAVRRGNTAGTLALIGGIVVVGTIGCLAGDCGTGVGD